LFSRETLHLNDYLFLVVRRAVVGTLMSGWLSFLVFSVDNEHAFEKEEKKNMKI
jgi:uncharacterized membrane protein